ncbi:MAG: DNA-binding winged helix-turn-helix (wHTH) protein [bacterium]
MLVRNNYRVDSWGVVQMPEDTMTVLKNIWGVNVNPLTNVVDVYVGRIREKVVQDDSSFIETVRGMGYRINPVIVPKATDG